MQEKYDITIQVLGTNTFDFLRKWALSRFFLFLGGVDETVLSAKEQQLLDALSPTAEAQGIEIVTVDIVGSKKAPTIRVYIDCEGGVASMS